MPNFFRPIRLRAWSRPCASALAAGALAFALLGVKPPVKVTPVEVNCPEVGQAIALDPLCPAMPNVPQTEVLKGGEIVAFPQPAYDRFAWNSFIAMNWPAIVPAASNNFQRGIPDTSKAFTSAKANELTVWETLKEKREIFYFGPDQNPGLTATPVTYPPDPGPWNQDFNYLGNNANDPTGADGIPWCDQPPVVMPERLLLQASKFGDSLDETTEVPSQALETTDQLCGGYTTTPCACNQEDNFTCLTATPAACCKMPTQAACCNVRGLAVQPAVWKKANATVGSPNRPVYYEVKLNYDYYDYVRQNRYYIDKVKTKDAHRKKGPHIKLPYRSNDKVPPIANIDKLNNPGRVLGYSAKACLEQYHHVHQFSVLHPSFAGDFSPCRVGAMQLKAAWIEVNPNWDDLSTYHTTQAIVYDENTHGICRRAGTFGLVGLHIIQRVHSQLPPGTKTPDGNTTLPPPVSYDPARSAKVVGGAFVFATWEHISIVANGDDQPSPDYVYANNFAGFSSAVPKPKPGVQVPRPGFYPKPQNGIAVQRYLGNETVLASTTTVNNEAYELLGCPRSGSVWCNYRLIGVQALPLEASENVLPPQPQAAAPSPVPPPPPNPACPKGKNDPYGICQPEFLANLVLETNVGLQQFRGQPPSANVLGFKNYKGANGGGIQANSDPLKFARGAANTAFGQYQTNSYLKGKLNPGFTPVAVNMGGCMGCHGIAQIQGTSFSFVLKNGQAGARPETPPLIP